MPLGDGPLFFDGKVKVEIFFHANIFFRELLTQTIFLCSGRRGNNLFLIKIISSTSFYDSKMIAKTNGKSIRISGLLSQV